MKALLEVFYRPGRVFAELPGAKGQWRIPLLCNVLLAVLLAWMVPHFIGPENIVRQRLAGNAAVTPEQAQKLIASAGSVGQAFASYAGTILFSLGMQAALAGMLTIFWMMRDPAPHFETMLSMVTLAFFPYWLILTAMTAQTLVTAANPAALDFSNLVATSAATYVDKHTVTRGVYGILSNLDALSFMEMGLLGLGFARVTRSGIAFGLAVVGGLWLLYFSVMAIAVLT